MEWFMLTLLLWYPCYRWVLWRMKRARMKANPYLVYDSKGRAVGRR